MAGFRLPARILAVAACLVATSCAKEAAPPGRCFLFVNFGCPPADYIDVFIDGEQVGTVRDVPLHTTGVNRFVFPSSGKTRFVFEIRQKNTQLYRPEFVLSTKAGDLVEAHFVAREAKESAEPSRAPSRSFGPGPSHDFPALISGVPARVWCWFGPANMIPDYVMVQLADGADAGAFKTRAAQGGYTIVREFQRGQVRVAPPKGVTIVEAALDLETWPGVKQVRFEPQRVY
jgi:hypothetical protein